MAERLAGKIGSCSTSKVTGNKKKNDMMVITWSQKQRSAKSEGVPLLGGAWSLTRHLPWCNKKPQEAVRLQWCHASLRDLKLPHLEQINVV